MKVNMIYVLTFFLISQINFHIFLDKEHEIIKKSHTNINSKCHKNSISMFSLLFQSMFHSKRFFCVLVIWSFFLAHFGITEFLEWKGKKKVLNICNKYVIIMQPYRGSEKFYQGKRNQFEFWKNRVIHYKCVMT